MNEPSVVDMSKFEAEILPAEVTKFAPEKYRASSTLSQATNDLRKRVTDLMRKHDEYAMAFKAQCDELLRMIG